MKQQNAHEGEQEGRNLSTTKQRSRDQASRAVSTLGSSPAYLVKARTALPHLPTTTAWRRGPFEPGLSHDPVKVTG